MGWNYHDVRSEPDPLDAADRSAPSSVPIRVVTGLAFSLTLVAAASVGGVAPSAGTVMSVSVPDPAFNVVGLGDARLLLTRSERGTLRIDVVAPASRRIFWLDGCGVHEVHDASARSAHIDLTVCAMEGENPLVVAVLAEDGRVVTTGLRLFRVPEDAQPRVVFLAADSRSSDWVFASGAIIGPGSTNIRVRTTTDEEGGLVLDAPLTDPESPLRTFTMARRFTPEDSTYCAAATTARGEGPASCISVCRGPRCERGGDGWVIAGDGKYAVAEAATLERIVRSAQGTAPSVSVAPRSADIVRALLPALASNVVHLQRRQWVAVTGSFRPEALRTLHDLLAARAQRRQTVIVWDAVDADDRSLPTPRTSDSPMCMWRASDPGQLSLRHRSLGGSLFHRVIASHRAADLAALVIGVAREVDEQSEKTQKPSLHCSGVSPNDVRLVWQD